MRPRYALQILLTVFLFCGVITCLESTPLNIGGVVRDSVSRDPLPLVKITIKKLEKSFTTSRSLFYIALEQGQYTFGLEAKNYEQMTKTIDVLEEGEEFVFEMVKVSDRVELDKQRDSLYLYTLGFNRAIDQGDLEDVDSCMHACIRFNVTTMQLDSMIYAYERLKVQWIDSIFLYAQALEDSQKISDAFYYYKKILSVDSLHEAARKKAEETEKILANKLAGNTQSVKSTNTGSSGTISSLTPEQVESIFNQGVAKFIAEDYEGALLFFQTVLKHDPGHEGGNTYLSRTQSRLQAIK